MVATVVGYGGFSCLTEVVEDKIIGGEEAREGRGQVI